MATPQRTNHAVIDPAKAWMLGVLVEEDGSLRPAPAPALSWGTAERDCTCPDYCEAEHDAEPR